MNYAFFFKPKKILNFPQFLNNKNKRCCDSPSCPPFLPRQPSITVADMEGESLRRTMAQLPKIVRAVKAATGAPAARVISNAGAESGQIVFHTHFHIIPKFSKDDPEKSSSEMVA